ncbi:MAG: alpha-ribazole phosphatase [Gaiellaceae bacterium]
MELVLVRHAEPTEDARGSCYGRLDIELSDSGREQCRRLAAHLSGEPVAAIVCSPRLRARDTADAIAEPHRLPVTVLDQLRELDFGEFEGRTYEEIAASRPELYERWMTEPTTLRFPGGEGYADLHARVADAVAQLRATYDGRMVVAVTHGGVVRAVLAEALGMPHDRIFRLAVDTASITRVEWCEGVAVVRSVNLST